MATISFTANGLSYSKTISAGDVTRLVSAAKILYGIPSATNQEVVDAVGRRLFSELVEMVRGVERQAAIVADVPLT